MWNNWSQRLGQTLGSVVGLQTTSLPLILPEGMRYAEQTGLLGSHEVRIGRVSAVPYDQFAVVSVKGKRTDELFLIIFIDSTFPVRGFLKASQPLTEMALRQALKDLERSDDETEFLIRIAREARTGQH